MRFLGIDYGSKRVGVALSDDGNTVAFPKAVLKSGPNLCAEIAAMARDADVRTVVLGESKDFRGAYNPIMEGAFRLKAGLEAEGFEVLLEPEFLTSAQAERQGETGMLDASAAALILQSHLDKRNNKPS